MCNKKEFAIGEEFQMGLLTLECIDDSTASKECADCAFYEMNNSYTIYCDTYIGYCNACDRVDGKDAIFKLKEQKQ